MSDIKLVAVDMDGTLLNNKKEMPGDFIPWVKAHPEICVVIASGRQYETLRQDFIEVENDLYFLADNGSFVYHNNELLYADQMDKTVVHELLRKIDTLYAVTPILCGAKSAYMRPASDSAAANAAMYYKKLIKTEDLYGCIDGDVIPKIACFYEHGDAADRFCEFEGIDDDTVPVLSGDSWIDILHKGINKGTGVRILQEKLGIRPGESMAFGDYMNDYDLLLTCEESYAMENGHPQLKEIAKHIAPSNEEEGVMQVLRRI